MTSEVEPLSDKFLDEPAAGRMTVQYRPVKNECTENPPRFSWLPVVDDDARYVLRVSDDKSFPEGSTTYFEDIAYNFYTPDSVFSPGTYYWSYAEWSASANSVLSHWSEVREFTLVADLPETPLISRTDRYTNAFTGHPRLWMQPDDIVKFKQTLKQHTYS